MFGYARVRLGEVGKFYGGLSGKSKDDFKNGNACFVSYKNVYSNIALDINPPDKVKIEKGEKQNVLEYGDVVFTGSSETPEECGFSSVVTEKPQNRLYLNSFCFFFRFDKFAEMLLPDFAKHLFRSHSMRKQICKTASGVTRFNVSKEKMKEIVIPIPSLSEQERIAKILDHFDALANSLSAGLPAEIDARQKQYEFYRDKLLAFKSMER